MSSRSDEHYSAATDKEDMVRDYDHGSVRADNGGNQSELKVEMDGVESEDETEQTIEQQVESLLPLFQAIVAVDQEIAGRGGH